MFFFFKNDLESNAGLSYFFFNKPKVMEQKILLPMQFVVHPVRALILNLFTDN